LFIGSGWKCSLEPQTWDTTILFLFISCIMKVCSRCLISYMTKRKGSAKVNGGPKTYHFWLTYGGKALFRSFHPTELMNTCFIKLEMVTFPGDTSQETFMGSVVLYWSYDGLLVMIEGYISWRHVSLILLDKLETKGFFFSRIQWAASTSGISTLDF
jgi:hypothetical protein